MLMLWIVWHLQKFTTTTPATGGGWKVQETDIARAAGDATPL